MGRLPTAIGFTSCRDGPNYAPYSRSAPITQSGVTTLKLSSKRRYLSFYNARGGAEVEQFRNDKQGLGLAARRKRRFPAQVGFVLLTDLAHNLLAHFYHQALVGSRFEPYGLKRIVRDLLAFPGRLVFDGPQLKRIELLSRKHYASDLMICLERYCSGE